MQIELTRRRMPLHSMTSPWPFAAWPDASSFNDFSLAIRSLGGIDIISPISPQASNGHRFILVAIDYKVGGSGFLQACPSKGRSPFLKNEYHLSIWST